MLCALAGIAVTPGPALEPGRWRARARGAAVVGQRRRVQPVRRARPRRAHEAHAAAPVRHRPVPPGAGLARSPSGSCWPSRCSPRRSRPTGSPPCTCSSARSSMAWSTRSGSSGAAGPTSWSAASPAASPCSPAPRRSIRAWRRSPLILARRAVPLDAAALLEPRHRPAQGLCRGRRADAAGGDRRWLRRPGSSSATPSR